MHATAHVVIIDHHYIGPLNSLYSFHSRSKTTVELIVAVDILDVFLKNVQKNPQEVKISKNTLPWFVLQLYWHWKRMVWLSMTGCRLKLRFSQQRAPTV